MSVFIFQASEAVQYPEIAGKIKEETKASGGLFSKFTSFWK